MIPQITYQTKFAKILAVIVLGVTLSGGGCSQNSTVRYEFAYEGDCKKAYSITRQYHSSVQFSDEIEIVNKITNDTVKIHRSYSNMNGNWSYELPNGDFKEWMSVSGFASKVEVELKHPSSTIVHTRLVPLKEDFYDGEKVLVYEVVSNDFSNRLSKEYYFSPTKGIVKIFDPYESKNCQTLKLDQITPSNN